MGTNSFVVGSIVVPDVFSPRRFLTFFVPNVSNVPKALGLFCFKNRYLNFFVPRGEHDVKCAHEPIKCFYLTRAQNLGTCPFTSIGHVFLTNQNRGHSLGTKKKLDTICIDQSESWAQTWAQFFARTYSESQ